MTDLYIPWAFAVATALCFGVMARRNGRSWFGWAFAGWLMALVTSTILAGLIQGASIPFSDHDANQLRLKSIAASFVSILVLGWLFTTPMHRHDRSLWRMLRKSRQDQPPERSVPSTSVPEAARR